MVYFRPVVPNLGSPGVLRLQLPDILASTASGEGLWDARLGFIARSYRRRGHTMKMTEY